MKQVKQHKIKQDKLKCVETLSELQYISLMLYLDNITLSSTHFKHHIIKNLSDVDKQKLSNISTASYKKLRSELELYNGKNLIAVDIAIIMRIIRKYI